MSEKINKQMEKKKSKISKALKVGSVPFTAASLLATGIIIPATVFSANIIGATTTKSKGETIRQHDKIYKDTPWNQTMSMNIDNVVGPFKVNGRDSHVWKITKPGEKNKKVTKAMIFIHGLRNTHWNAITFAKQMLDRGYVVYCYDQREAGENIDNGKISFGQNEANDLDNLYTNVIKENDSLSKLIVYGQSNGAGTTLSFAEKYQKHVQEVKIKYGVDTNFMIESGFISGHNAIDGLVEGTAHLGKYLAWITTPQMMNTMNEFMGVNDDFNYKEHINEIMQKLYIVHGAKDSVVPVEQARELNAARTDKVKTLYHEWKDLGHIGISLAKKSQDEMFKEAIWFLEKTKEKRQIIRDKFSPLIPIFNSKDRKTKFKDNNEENNKVIDENIISTNKKIKGENGRNYKDDIEKENTLKKRDKGEYSDK